MKMYKIIIVNFLIAFSFKNNLNGMHNIFKREFRLSLKKINLKDFLKLYKFCNNKKNKIDISKFFPKNYEERVRFFKFVELISRNSKGNSDFSNYINNNNSKALIMSKKPELNSFLAGKLPFEVNEIIDFIANSEKYKDMGAQMPKGILFVGPPGTGKTSIARAISEVLHIPFLHFCATEFRQKYVGEGERLIREAFKNALIAANQVETGPKVSIIFIDELDTLGSRAKDNNNVKQGIQELLNQLDGFNKHDQVIFIGATNDPDNIDPALKRPGRIDRIVHIGLPDLENREAILKFYLCKIKHDKDSVNIKKIAIQTDGSSQADLKHIINESAIIAVRKKSFIVNMSHIDESLEVFKKRKKLSNLSLGNKDHDEEASLDKLVEVYSYILNINKKI